MFNCSMNMAEQIIKLARDMASYIHHSGYPVYDGGHTEPEDQCQNPDCVAVRTEIVKSQS